MSNFLFLGILVFFIFYIFVNVIVFIFRVLSSVSETTKKTSSLREQRNRQTIQGVERNNTDRNRNADVQSRKNKLLKSPNSSQSARNRIQSKKETPTARETFSAERVSQEGRRFESFDSRQGRPGKEGSQGLEGTEFHTKGFHSAKKGKSATTKTMKKKALKKHNDWLQAIVYKEILDKPRSQRSIR